MHIDAMLNTYKTSFETNGVQAVFKLTSWKTRLMAFYITLTLSSEEKALAYVLGFCCCYGILTPNSHGTYLSDS